METQDANALAEAARRCLMLSLDGAYSPAQQAELNASGKRLRGAWLNLVSARFDAGPARMLLADLAHRLREANHDLDAKLSSERSFSAMMRNIDQAVALADRLLGMVARFA